MKSALSDSLKAEDAAVKSRFDRAERLLGDTPPSKPPSATSASDREAPKVRVIRDSFTLPAGDYDLIAAVRQRCLSAAVNVTKSEVIRAGLQALQQMPEPDLIRLVNSLEKIKTGRPPEKKK